MDLSYSTPEHIPDCCPRCGGPVAIEPPAPLRDAPCPHCGHVLWFVRKRLGEVVVVTFRPGLVSGSECVQRIDEVWAALGNASRVVLNLSYLPFMSSLFLGMLVALDRRLTAAGGTMKVCGLQPQTLEALTIAKLDTILDICDDEQTALQNV